MEELLEKRLFTPANRAALSLREDTIVPSCAVTNDAELQEQLFLQGTGIGCSLPNPGRIASICRAANRRIRGRIPGVMVTYPWKQAAAFRGLKVRPLADASLVGVNVSMVIPRYLLTDFLDSADGKQLLHDTWSCGDPGIIFSHNLHQATAPCGELWLDQGEACTLGALNLAKCADAKGHPKESEIARILRVAVPELDSLVDRLRLPPSMLGISRESRRLGIGVAGWHTMLENCGLTYEEGAELAPIWSRAVARAAHQADNKPWRKGLMALAPTTRMAQNLGGVTMGIEKWGKRPDTEIYMRTVAGWQENVDGAVSHTVNLPHEATKEDICATMLRAEEMGFKSVAIYRDGSIQTS